MVFIADKDNVIITWKHFYNMLNNWLIINFNESGIENYDKMRNDTFNVGGDFNNYNKEEIALMIKHKVDYYLHFAEFGEDEDKRNYEVSYEKINNAGFRIKKTVEEGINELIQAVPALDSRSKYKNV